MGGRLYCENERGRAVEGTMNTSLPAAGLFSFPEV